MLHITLNISYFFLTFSDLEDKRRQASRRAEEEEQSAAVGGNSLELSFVFFQEKEAWALGLAFVPVVNLVATPLLLGEETDIFSFFSDSFFQWEHRATKKLPMNCSSKGADCLHRGTHWRTK